MPIGTACKDLESSNQVAQGLAAENRSLYIM